MTVRYVADGDVAVITIDRIEVANAVDRPTATALADAFRRFDGDESLAVAVLTGAGGTFCAGADLKAIQETAERSPDDRSAVRAVRVEPDGDGPVGPTRLLLGKPVVAAVEGHAVAGGLELALWCDLRVAAEDATFGVYCRRWGVPLMDGGTVRLPRLIGHGRALDLILTGRGVGAAEALAMGLADRVVPTGTALDAALALAHQIASLPQAAVRGDRRSTYEQWALPLGDALTNEYHHGMSTLSSGETLAGVARYSHGNWAPTDFA
jgi:enoyl-CoA hydratase